LDSGQLIAPEGDSAYDHLATLESEGADLAGLPALWDGLTGALASNARDGIAALDWAGAQGWVDALERTGRDVDTAESLAQEIAAGRLQEEYLATPAPASELTLASYAPPVYPEDAVDREIEGWVELDYVVDKRGNVRDVVAIAAEPRGRFERAATAAVEQYRYEPFTRDGQAYERRLRLRVTFNLR
jgi:protein TonB